MIARAVLGIVVFVGLAGATPELAAASDFVTQEVPSAIDQAPQLDFGLPEREPPPRTLRDQWPVFALLSLFWLAIVGYALTFKGKLQRLEEKLTAEAGARSELERRQS